MILDRIKTYIDFKGISISAFEKSIGMSNASFGKSLKKGGAIGTDKLENILSVYQDLSPSWLMTGRGEMLLSGVEDTAQPIHTDTPSNEVENRLLRNMLAEKDNIIRSQAEEIGKLREQLTQAMRRLEKDASNAYTSDIADVG